MPKAKGAYATIKSLYGELEAARREFEQLAGDERFDWKSQGEGGKAYLLWLELLDLADWVGGDRPSEDDGEDSVDPPEGEDDVSDVDPRQVDIPLARSLDGREQAGMHQAAGLQSPVAHDELIQHNGVGVVGGAVPGLTYSVNKRKNNAPRGR